MFNVYQHWDPLKVCVVGRSYPPEFYHWIKKPNVRSLFEKIAIETEEDYQGIIKKLKEFNVEILRPDLPTTPWNGVQYTPPPMTPRDYNVMIGNTFYTCQGFTDQKFREFYNGVKDAHWPACQNLKDFYKLPTKIQEECVKVHNFNKFVLNPDSMTSIVTYIKNQGNTIKENLNGYINGAMVTRIGKDLYVGTESYDADIHKIKSLVDQEFHFTRNHIINTGGHSDGTFCPVCPGLIISLYDVPTYANTFPNWEVVYLPSQSWALVEDFLHLKKKNKGKWWIPGFEYDQDVVDVVDTWLDHWTGYVEETVFDVNMLIVNPKNVLVFNYNKQVFDALNRYGITPHIVPFRHRYFWDGGIHCVTSDLHREGTMQDYFPERG